MNINEFERNKPAKTKKAIEDLIVYVDGCISENASNNTYDFRLESLKDRLSNLKEVFLKGE
jgi:hypothetical protein